ncbi:MAG: hypothetical protein HFH49_04390 [Lachnospiraceae bacterium]|nr:hypothetical protein [Lachnospiraceae bacterium]
MYISKNIIIRKIRRAAQNYKEKLIGKTFIFVYDGKYIEVIFKKSCFLHLTGVNSNLGAEDFYKHAVNGNNLKPSEIKFDSDHPFDLADKKTDVLHNLYKITVQDVLIMDNVITLSATNKIGIADLKMTILFGENTDKIGNKINDCLVPYSFRVESIDNGRFENIYTVDFVFEKETGKKKYSNITFQDKKEIEDLPEKILEKIEIS